MPVLITAKINGFRRCGIGHSDITTSYPDDRFTTAQLAELQAEPLLVVTVVSEAEGASQNDDTLSRIDALTSEVSQLTNELADVTQTLDTVTAERDTLKNDDTLSRIDALTAEVSRLTNELADVTPTLDTVTAERDTLKKELAELNKEMKKNAKNPGS